MSLNEQIQPTDVPTDDAPESQVQGQVRIRGVDDILDEIDSVLQTNAAAFVQGFVQKGGQ